jgi:hypothetical protein
MRWPILRHDPSNDDAAAVTQVGTGCGDPDRGLNVPCGDHEVAARLPVRLFVEERCAEGADQATIDAQVEAGYKAGRFLAPRKPGLVYMLSDHNYVFDPDRRAIIHFPGHLMFYAPYATAKDVGSGPWRADGHLARHTARPDDRRSGRAIARPSLNR